MLNYRIINHNNLYYLGLTVLAIALPVSVFLMSVAQFILVINWILEGNFRNKYYTLLHRKSILLFVSVYIVHILVLIYTNYPEGFFGEGYNALKDIRIKLPVLLLPVIIGTSEGLDLKKLKYLLLLFIASVTASTLISTATLLGFTNYPVNDIRDISIYISHIRFSLLINMAIFSLGYFLFSKKTVLSAFEKALFTVVISWLIIFLFILQSLTGITVLIISGLILSCYIAGKVKNLYFRIFMAGVTITVILFLILYVRTIITKYYTMEHIERETIDKVTLLGNPYYHNFNSTAVENGHYVDLFVCEKELRDSWNRISSIKFDSLDNKKQELKATLIRYLTSKGLRKDAGGISRLSPVDIAMIEKGYANCIYKNRRSLYPRIYEIIWELDRYHKGENPSGHSISQRIEYFKTARLIIKNNFWFGVGTGDAQKEFNLQYSKMKSPLKPECRLRAHNQFVTFFITFGFIGFLWIMFAIIYPIKLERRAGDFLFIIFLIIAFISMLNEDTWETQAGVTFFVFFYVLFLMGRKPESEKY